MRSRGAIVAAVAAIVLAAATAVVLAVAGEELRGLVAYLGGFATVMLGFAVVAGVPMLVAPAITTITVAAGVTVVLHHDVVRVDAVAAGIAIYLVAELAYRSLEGREPLRVDGAVLLAHIAPVLAISLGSAAAGVGLLAVATDAHGAGAGAEAIGLLAALGVVVVVAMLARGRPPTRG